MPLHGEPLQPPIPKPELRARRKARKQRAASRVVKSVRQQCVERDGYCRVLLEAFRYGGSGHVRCYGSAEWAHLGDKKRFKTRGQAPEVRHTTAGSLMLCTKHHQDYDQGRMVIEGENANEPLRFVRV